MQDSIKLQNERLWAKAQSLPAGNKNYPKLLSLIKNPPKEIYYKGTTKTKNKNAFSIFDRCLSVVGSRRMTPYGEQVTLKIVSEIASFGITIVSGFMYGIDATAHKAALLVDGTTIAIMPCGIDNIIPAYQRDLYEQIIDTGGLIISEYSYDLAPKPWMFIKRNRLVAGISSAVLVVEAAENSGSLVTADFALEFKRKVFVVTNSIFTENSKGIIGLLKKGAIPISSAKDILDFYGFNTQTSSKSFVDNKTWNKILTVLTKGPMTTDEICQNINLNINSLNTQLTKMQLQGIIKESEGKMYVC